MVARLPNVRQSETLPELRALLAPVPALLPQAARVSDWAHDVHYERPDAYQDAARLQREEDAETLRVHARTEDRHWARLLASRTAGAASPFCLDPAACHGKGFCPRDPACDN